MNEKKWLSASFCAIGIAGLFSYTAIALFFGKPITAGKILDAPDILISATFVFLGAMTLLAQMINRNMISLESITGLSVALPIILIGLITLDSVYSAYVEQSAPPLPRNEREFDSYFSADEFYPPLYYPTPRNFRLHRPNISIIGNHYGDYYAAQMLHSQTMRDQVLSLKHVGITIDQYGLRESRSFDGARIAALGDSFTFGWGVDDEHIWVRQIENHYGERVVNLGIHDASPKQELELLKYILAKQGQHLPLKQLIWLLYEGNDLEDSYSENAPETKPRQWQRGMAPMLNTLFHNIKDNMVIEQFRQHRVQLIGKTHTNSHLNIDGVPLNVPLYRSSVLGPALFLSTFIERGIQPKRYVLEHENRGRLDQTFEEMARLARERDFRIVVVMAPTAARLYGRYFDDFPALSESPYFIDYVSALAQKHGLLFINLFQLFSAQASKEFLYFRDDDHWNEKGHALTSEMIARYAFME